MFLIVAIFILIRKKMMDTCCAENNLNQSKGTVSQRMEPTACLPLVEISGAGQIKISGNSISTESFEFYQSLFSAIDSIYSNKVCVSIMFENINAESIRGLYLMIKRISEHRNLTEIDVFWFYSGNNEDFKEVGEIFQEMFPMINFSIFRI